MEVDRRRFGVEVVADELGGFIEMAALGVLARVVACFTGVGSLLDMTSRSWICFGLVLNSNCNPCMLVQSHLNEKQ